ncbi:CBS domain-containing protein (plasmid) [Ensifer adhaerens]|uniref:CBS domain-containing protein n=1 Tax=Ensifer adhaerens TaxID=106592 RepID=UPI001CBB69AE|nr:CBS domain-containing protein [Ensifer adhaerens]MBZ7927661.1 CBS domain-containing protein [Ensifer adhaerens]UAX98057.1 CBS domain-containing protein [Ensifer adhaerens]UAY05438.1 CBS domain-containing protein [Ensifer adhaerens]UAY12816.1 CBS domain-containing protein [Ensifer adhaerens]
MDAPDAQSARSLMTRTVYSISPNDSAQSAARLMSEAGVSMLPVEAPSVGAILGIVTDRDLVVKVVAKGLASTTAVYEFMKVSAETCFADDNILGVAQKMVDAGHRRLVVIDETRRAVGILALNDIVGRHPGVASLVESGLQKLKQ